MVDLYVTYVSAPNEVKNDKILADAICWWSIY